MAAPTIDTFLFLESKSGVIKGESLDSIHTGEIQLHSFSTGVSNSSKGAGGAGDWKPDFTDFTVTHKVSKASPLLFKAASDGTLFKRVTIGLRKMGAKLQGEANGDFLQYRFCNALISNYSVSVGDEPIETISYSFQTVEIMYIEQTQKGTLEEKFQKGWHVGKNIELTDLTLPYKGGGAK